MEEHEPSLSSLPPELKEKILLESSPKELISLCSSSREFRSFCSEITFWRRKFRKVGLPLLQEGNSLREWLSIYKRSLEAAEETEQTLRKFAQVPKGSLLVISPRDLSTPQPLLWLNIPINVEVWRKAREVHFILEETRRFPERKAQLLEKLEPLLKYSSFAVIIKREGNYYLRYRSTTPNSSTDEEILLPPQVLEEFLYRYYFAL